MIVRWNIEVVYFLEQMFQICSGIVLLYFSRDVRIPENRVILASTLSKSMKIYVFKMQIMNVHRK